MQIMRRICAVLTCIFMMSAFAIPAGAMEDADLYSRSDICPFASAYYEFTLTPNEKKEVDSEFFLAAGETIEIDATYKPTSANLDFIIVTSSGVSYRFSGKGGSFTKTVQVPENGSYSLVVRNNSNSTVEVTGEVYY